MRLKLLFFIGIFCIEDGQESQEISEVEKLTIPTGSHYDWKDGIVILDTTNFDQIYNSDTLWAVLFYSKWCAHCLGVSEQFKKFAFDIKDWSPWIRLGAIDCAEEGIDGKSNGEDVCFRTPFLVSSMPDFRFFPKHVKIKNDRRDDFSGIKREIKMSSVSISGKDIWTGYQAEDFRKMVLDFVGTNFDKDKIHFKPISVEVANDLIRNNIGYLALFLESRKDQTMKIAQMDLAGFEGITVRRLNINVTATRELMKSYELPIEPCLIILRENSLIKQVFYPGFAKRAFIRDTLRQLDIIPPVYNRLKHEVALEELRGVGAYDNFKTADQNKIYMQDLESALYYMIKKEAKAKDIYTQAEQIGLFQTIRMIDQFLPKREMVRKFFQHMVKRINGLKTDTLTHEGYLNLVKKADNILGAYLPERESYVACAGSKPFYRGFPCSKWQVWHFMTVEAYRSKLQGAVKDVLRAMRGYVTNYFTCQTCKEHFTEETGNLETAFETNKDGVIYLWKLHNSVNARIAGSKTDDPLAPKKLWPSKENCPLCEDSEDAVLEYLLAFYSRENLSEEHMVVNSKGEDIALIKPTREKTKEEL